MSIPLRNFRKAMFAITTALVLAGCGGGGDGGSAAVSAAPGGGSSGGGSSGGGGGTGGGDSGGGFSGPGTLRFALTDAPACGFNEVNVTVERVRVHQSSTADDNDGGWFDIPVVNGPRKVNLLSLTNGVLMELGQTTLTAGHYSQIRLVLVSNKSKSMSNTVKPKGGVEIEIDTPSAAQSGLKLINGFTVAPGAMTDIVLDFDACKSVHRKGHGGYSLKPVLRTCPRSLTAIAGYVQMPTGLTGVTVSAQKNGVVMKATQPNASGQFVLSPLDPTKGPYDVVFTGTNLTTSVIALVPVAAGQTTTLNSILDPVKMPSSPSGTVVGTVGPAGAAATGSVRALQTVGTVPVVEVADVNVDPTTGDYSLFLPTAAPRLLIYSDPLVTPLNFQAQNASAGKYRLEASATGYQTQLGGEITVTFGSLLLDQDFTLVPVTAAAIAGYVQSGLTGVTVSAQKNGVIVKATQPNASGQFVLGSLDAMNGPYEVVFTGANLTTSVIASVPVAVGQTTALGSSLDPVTMPTSTSGTLTGNVGPAGATATGLVRALQAVGTVPAVEVARVNVNPLNGDYSLFLPTAAPRLLVYSSSMVTPLNFQTQNASAGKYRLEASATGYQTQLGSEITVTFGSILPNQNFTLIPSAFAAIAGYVQPGLMAVTISAQKNGVVLKATQPSESGQFVLFLDATSGPYDVVFTGTNLTTSVIASVPLVAQQATTLGSSLDPVMMPSSPSGTVVGNVGPAGARDSGLVRALQAVGTVPAVEVARVDVNPLNGDYSLFLPTAAPRLLIYSSQMITPLNFQAQPASAGKYRLAASATGYLTALGSEVTVLFGSILGGQDFTLAAAK